MSNIELYYIVKIVIMQLVNQYSLNNEMKKNMSEFLMKSKVDFAFKEIMMNEQARIGFCLLY